MVEAHAKEKADQFIQEGFREITLHEFSSLALMMNLHLFLNLQSSFSPSFMSLLQPYSRQGVQLENMAEVKSKTFFERKQKKAFERESKSRAASGKGTNLCNCQSASIRLLPVARQQHDLKLPLVAVGCLQASCGTS